MAIAPNPLAFLSNDKTYFAVSLVADQAVDHVSPDLFECPGPGDVCFFIKPCLQFDQDRYLFARLGRAR